MAVYERFDVLEKEIVDLVKQLKAKIALLNDMNTKIDQAMDLVGKVVKGKD